jgi:hypothetical protein
MGCKIPHELDALKWKAIGRRRHMHIKTATLFEQGVPGRTPKSE